MATFKRSGPAIGARPGTLAIPAGSPPPQVRIVQYSKEKGAHEWELENVAQLDTLDWEAGMTWVDVQGLGDEEVLRAIGRTFELHPVVLEAAVNIPTRAKSEYYDGYHLLIARAPAPNEELAAMPRQVCMVFGEGFLLTFQERYFGYFDAVRDRLRDGRGPMRSLGSDYLAYALLDALVDHYFPVTEALHQKLEALEEEITQDPHPDILRDLHAIRRELVVLRRVGWPQREAISSLLRDDSPFVSKHVRQYLRDTYDHIAQIVELLDSARETAVGLSEIYLSQVSFKTNEVMKVLTLMASIFIPLTFIAGIYGMNFENMPELQSTTGYFIVLGVMVAVALGMIAFFSSKGWLGTPRRRRPRVDKRSPRETEDT